MDALAQLVRGKPLAAIEAREALLKDFDNLGRAVCLKRILVIWHKGGLRCHVSDHNKSALPLGNFIPLSLFSLARLVLGDLDDHPGQPTG